MKKPVRLAILSALSGVILTLVIPLNLFALTGTSFLLAGLFTAGICAVGISLGAITKAPPTVLTSEQTVTLLESERLVTRYLENIGTTAYFREMLESIREQSAALRRKKAVIAEIITKQFGASGISAAKFLAPVDELESTLAESVSTLNSRLLVFDEAEYENKLRSGGNDPRGNEWLREYKALNDEHQAYAAKVRDLFHAAGVKMDRLALEISKLGEKDIDQAFAILHELDEVSAETKLYKQN